MELLAWGTKTQRNAREKLKSCGLLQERQRGAWIRVDMDELMEQLAPGWHENDCNINNEQTPAGALVKMEKTISTNAPAVPFTAHRFLQPANIMLQMPVPQKGQQPSSSKLQPPSPREKAAAISTLVMPKALNAVLHDAARRTVACIEPGEQQMLLAELAGQMGAKSIANPIGYLHALVKKHKDGGLVPAFANTVADERAYREKLPALLAQQERAAAEAAKARLAALKARVQTDTPAGRQNEPKRNACRVTQNGPSQDEEKKMQ